MSCELQGEYCSSILSTKLVAIETSLKGSKKIASDYSTAAKSSKNPANFVKIGLDVETGPTEVTKSIKK